MENNDWYVYIMECRDRTLYTGVTRDIAKRLATHNAGKGAKYTATRTPLTLVWTEACADRSSALRREFEIKQLSRLQKLELTKK